VIFTRPQLSENKAATGGDVYPHRLSQGFLEKHTLSEECNITDFNPGRT